ncbi:MAG TPA: sigma-70 family RNA polymerase sigma factor [Sedimentisphaerales bacterium]|nr:sigma-70 family RNA polymerase sigma factor [Sedimentisphaerales bacterium]
MNDRSDENLVVACRAGDRIAYELLVKRHYKHVFLICLGILGNVHDAEDIAQDALLKSYVRIGTLRDDSQFGPWLARIAKNLCVNFIRRKKYTKTVAAERAVHANQSATDHDNLQQAIEQLPQEIRAPLVMYFFDGQSVKKVAKRLDMSSSGVYLKLRTALSQLHNLLAKQRDEKNE